MRYADGAALYVSALAGLTTVAVSTDVIAETRTTVNIIADTRTGTKDKVIVVARFTHSGQCRLRPVARSPLPNDRLS